MPSAEDELLQVYFPSGLPTGHASTRSRIHEIGLWHLTLQFWIVRRSRDGSHRLLFQERHLSQQAWPGKLDTTSAGHVLQGETDLFRELEEELGVRPSANDVSFVGVRRWDDAADPNMIDRELHQTYIWINDLPLDAYRLQPDEVTALVELTLSDAEALVTDKSHAVPGVRYEMSEAQRSVTVRKDMLVPVVDGYYLKVIDAARRRIAGESETEIIHGWLPNPIL
ncbi:MAG: NUDIX domain-containing protein [Chloroflexi bacterium]|nr:NUDIX domain-containing protein [Chloroflexota bacterium]